MENFIYLYSDYYEVMSIILICPNIQIIDRGSLMQHLERFFIKLFFFIFFGSQGRCTDVFNISNFQLPVV